MKEDAASAESAARSSRRTLLLLAVFSAGFVLALAGALYAKRRLRRPARDPSPLTMRLEVAPSGSLSLVFTNVSHVPVPLVAPVGSRTGPEIDVVVDSGEAERLEGPIQTGEGPVFLIPPGQSFVQDLPLAEYVRLRGRATIHVERARLRVEEPRLRSNAVVVEKR